MTMDQRPEPVRTVESFDAFYARTVRDLVGLGYVLTGSRSLAEELAQEALLAAYRRWSRISRYDDPGAWARRVVANRSVSAFRRRAAEVRGLARVGLDRCLVPPPAEPADETLWRAVRSLPSKQAQAIALRYLEDRSTTEIAAVLDVAEPTVRVLLHRAHKALATQLGTTTEEGPV